MRFPTWLYFLATTLSLALPSFASLALAENRENTLSWQPTASHLTPDYSGSWKGRWTSSPQPNRQGHIRRGHGGTLRVRLQRLNSYGGRPTYKGTFAGRFAVVIPYFYRTTVYQEGTQLYANKRLGPFGSYKMHLSSPHGRQMNGRWQAGKQHGTIRLARARR